MLAGDKIMYKESWNQLVQELKEEIPSHDFEVWFHPIKYIRGEGEDVILSVPTNYNQIWLSDNYLEQIKRRLNNITGKFLNIKIYVADDGNGQELQGTKPGIHIQSSNPRNDSFLVKHGMIPQYTFERFVVGENNALANAAALKVALNPGTAYNPLFIHGGVGLGKTHLMHAVGHKLHNKDINLKIAYLTSEEFMNLFIDSILKKTQTRFRNRFRNLDILLLDDVQFLLDKKDSKIELFNTFNALHTRRKQIILTSDRTPRDLERGGMDARLASRFGSGLAVEIRPPSIETKQAILMAKAEEEGVSIPNEVIMFVAGVVDADIRKLEEVLTRVIARHQLLDEEINLPNVENWLKDLAENVAPKNVSFEDIIRETSNTFRLSKSDIRSKSRTSLINQARQIVMYLAQRYTGMSLKEIGMELDREHPTIISGIKKITNSLESDIKLKDKVKEIIENLKLKRH